jgi:hypothetical protein
MVLSGLYAGRGKLKAAAAAMPLERVPINRREDSFMLSVLSGLVVAGAGGAGFWYLKPRDGRVNPLTVMPVLDWLLPTLLVGAVVSGVSLIVAGLV